LKINKVSRLLACLLCFRLLGHASTETTEKVYADYITSTLKDKMMDLGFDFLPELVG